jgi:hypothetical protein
MDKTIPYYFTATARKAGEVRIEEDLCDTIACTVVSSSVHRLGKPLFFGATHGEGYTDPACYVLVPDLELAGV